MKKILSVLLILVLLLSPLSAFAATLKKGSTGEEVVKLQQRLIELEFLSGEASGEYDDATRGAVAAFQEYVNRHGTKIDIDGCAGDTTVKYLFSEKAALLRRSLSIGDNNDEVKAAQERLIELGMLSGTADGIFGAKTEAAVKQFQQLIVTHDDSIQVNGIIDKNTGEWLKKDLSALGIKLPAYFDETRPLTLEDAYLYTTNCILIDADTGDVLYERDPDSKVYPASTTKIMTLLLACEYADDKFDKIVTVPKIADEVPADSSRVPVHEGERMPFRDLLYGLMLRSGNDAANAIAVLMGKNTANFAKRMNMRAEELGMTGTLYHNAHGYHNAEHYTTARDLATLTRAAIANELFREIVSAKEYTMAATEKRAALELKTNYLILDETSPYYYPYAWGVKTGTTSAAGYCYVGAATKDGRTLIAVVMSSGSIETNKWTDAKHLFQYGFAKLEADGQ